MNLTLTFNANSSSFKGIAKYNAKEYNVSVLDFTEHDINAATHVAYRACIWLDENFESVERFVTDNLLSLKNSEWRYEDEAELSETDFINTIKLDGVMAFSDGSFDVLFKDGDLFGGHWINVGIDSDFNLGSADLWG